MNGLHKVYLLTGSNIGDRKKNLDLAKEKIRKAIGAVEAQSKIYETQPWGLADQDDFLNQALEVRTPLTPREVLKQAKKIEEEMGRVKSEKWVARLIDIDLIFFDEMVLQEDGLVLPHPHFHERNFALVPVMELVPEMLHPVLHQTVEDLYWDSKDDLDVSVFEG